MRVPPIRKSVVLLSALALLLGLVPGATAQPVDCGPIVPTAEVVRGMVGQGLTVVQGTDPEPFDVEVLGVLEGGIGVGRDMIVVEVSSPAIAEAGGIWQGMSGSPVYVGDRLLGAVAYGLAATPSGIGGLTPAEDLVDLIDLPAGDTAFTALPAQEAPADRALATGDLAAEIHRRVGGSAFSQSGVELRRLPLPLSVSGLSAERLDVLEAAAGRAGRSLSAHGGSRAAYGQTAATPAPGDNLAAVQSMGDLTAAAIGTTTLVCDGHTVGFGHPFTFAGGTLSGGATADAITIVPDDTFAPYKLANVGGLFGTLDQDRLAGIRMRNGDRPDVVPVTSDVADGDLGRSRDGRTDVIDRRALPDLTAFHLLGSIDSTIDRIGAGTATLTATVTGEGADSGPFTYARGNVFASDFDVAFESVFELLGHIAALQQFPGEDVRVTGVDVGVEVVEAVSTYAIDDVRVGVDGEPPAPVAAEVVVRPGSLVDVEVDLAGEGLDEPLGVALQVQVPQDAFGSGFLEVIGGTGFAGDECLFFPELCAGDDAVETAQDLADALAAQARNDEVAANLLVPTLEDGGPFPGPTPTEPPPPTPQPTATPVPGSADSPAGSSSSSAAGTADGPRYAQVGTPVTDRAQVDRVVRGALGFAVAVDSPICPGCPPVFDRVAGEDRIATAAGIALRTLGVAETVVIAPAADYPYALVGGPLANREGGPVLLTGEGGLDPRTASAITQLGATRAIVIAPDGQLAGLEADLSAIGVTADRIDGADRYAVAAAVAQRVGGPRAWVVEGEHPDPARGWPDAISAAAVAGLEGAPILLTRAGDLPAATADALLALGTTDVSIAGGTAAVSQAVEDDLLARGLAVERLAGDTRDQTSYLLARRAVELGAIPQTTWVVTAGDFPDALAAAPAVVASGGVLILADGTDVFRTPGAVQHFTDLRYTAPFVTFVGGFAAISQDVEVQVFDILIGQEP